jgi:hypothetical protein
MSATAGHADSSSEDKSCCKQQGRQHRIVKKCLNDSIVPIMVEKKTNIARTVT